MSVATIAEYCWDTYTPRTLVSGTPDPPENQAEQYAKTIWEYAPRTLTGGGETATPDVLTSFVS